MGHVPDLVLLVFLIIRFFQFFGGVMCMYWVFEDSEKNRQTLKKGLAIYLVAQTIMQVLNYVVLSVLATQSGFPSGIFGPFASIVYFAYEILWFYYWSVARRYDDLMHLNKGAQVNEYPDIELEKGRPMAIN